MIESLKVDAVSLMLSLKLFLGQRKQLELGSSIDTMLSKALAMLAEW